MADEFDPIGAVEQILTAHGPLSEDELLRRAQEAGATYLEFEELLDDVGDVIGHLVDERWVWLPTVLDGRVLTRRVTADELTHDILIVAPDLEPVLATPDATFTDATPAVVVSPLLDARALGERGIPSEAVDRNGALLLSAGTLSQLGVSQGELVGVRLTEQGLAVERVDAPAEAPVGERLAALLNDPPVDLAGAVWTLCQQDRTLFTDPLLPLGEIIDAQGLKRRADLLAPADFNFGAWDFERDCEHLAFLHDLAPEETLALTTLLTMHRQYSTLVAADPDEELQSPEEFEGSPWVADFTDVSGELGAVLAEPELAEVLASETAGTGRAGAAGLGMLAESLEPKVPRSAQVACRWLRAVSLERLGDVEGAERELLAAESMNTDWAPVLFDLARFASDRGDAERGLSLLRRADAEPDDAMLALLERHLAQPRNDLGRNDTCWCGSGRKYKKCHLGHEPLSLAERAGWLYSKAAQHTVLSGWDDMLDEVAYERSRYSEGSGEILAALGDPLVMDAVLFEGGAFEEFLAVRGALLPDDERSLAEQWLLVDRSVFEVEHVNRGLGFTVRDLRTGDTHEVQEKSGSRQLKAGQLICARVLPAGDTMQLFGGMEPVALHERDALIELLDAEPDPTELVAFLSRRFAPPTMVNTDGDPIVMCRATVKADDVAGLQTALDDRYHRSADQDLPQWYEHITTHGMNRIGASLTLDGEMLTVDTNSERRMARVLAALKQLDPELQVVEEVRRPLDDFDDVAALAAHMPAQDADSPEVAAALEDFIRDYETKWLDQPIPALNGHTPRQAADDPTRRGDLIKLLDSFPVDGAARGGMDVGRLRLALGLE
ncbi:hypothetical protein BTO20_06975 [Mycobacterium dioxanotrophicus]|uniref:Zinc-binding protein n=1 Tax=Mycobacterium dioxanotrophicus TaxID=482462 RepID=A0A1Y0BZP6_9MYCO|nr:SEC-C domain-containing protein [Mycobacterium dioxanotrophicus]ART68354.1 hypothetical protein BTO20_06975 [Mycobacterium dioxanotrophicus]